MVLHFPLWVIMDNNAAEMVQRVAGSKLQHLAIAGGISKAEDGFLANTVENALAFAAMVVQVQ